jgi:hypothetical protein
LLVARKQTVEDIFELVKRGVRDSQAQAQLIAWYFVGENKKQTCYNIWQFLKNNIRYERETKDLQTVKTLSRLLKQDKKGDCKHFSTAVGCLLTQLNIPFVFRLVSFNYYDSTPTHIYVVAKVNGEDVYIDCVLNEFNSESAYKSKTDKKCR